MNDYDLTIIGAGPAGATLARLLAGKYRILLVDPARPKCCGGLLAPDAQKLIAQLGLILPDSVLEGPQLFSVHTLDFDNGLSRHYQRHYINMNRERFDRWLLSLIPSSVDLRIPGRFDHATIDSDGGLTVHVRHDGHVTPLQTKVLIGADGAFSAVRRHFFPEQKDRKMYVAIQHWFEPGIESSCFGAIFDREITDYYSWTIPKGNRLIVGAAIPTQTDLRSRFERLLTKLRKQGYPLENLQLREAAQIVRPCSTRAVCPVYAGLPVALLGEAAGFISPSSAEGISYAMRSAIALADAFEPGLDGFQDRYRRNVRSLFVNIMGKNMKRPAMYAPVIRRWIMKTGISSLNIRKEIR